MRSSRRENPKPTPLFIPEFPCVLIQQAPDHFLVRYVITVRLALEELDAASTEGDGHLDSLVAKCQLGGRREEIGDNPNLVDFAFSVIDCGGHIAVFPCASSRRQIVECGPHDR